MTSLLPAVRLGAQTPRVRVRPEGIVRTLGPDACELAASCGLVADPWQELALEDGLALRADRLWAASSVDEIASRQNGKNVSAEIRELYGLLILGEWIIHTSHLFKTTRESFNRLEALVDGNPDVKELLTYKVASPASGYEMRFATGGRIHFIARSRTSGRGLTGDVLVLDEAQDLDDDSLGAVLPTISQGPQNNPQTWYLGSAPGPLSVVWHRRRLAGRGGGSPRSAYLEFSADPGCDLDDRDQWALANPGFGARLLEETVEAERSQMSDEMFARERLSVSPDLLVAGAVVPVEAWAACEDAKASFDAVTSAPVFAVDVTPDRSFCSIAVAGMRSDGLAYVEIVDNRPGTAWVERRLEELRRTWRPARIVADPAGPAGSLLSEHVEAVGAREHAQACGMFYDLVTGGRMRHRPEPLLDVALAGAVKRDVGDGLWMWSRKSSTVDISPLVAATLALGAIPQTTAVAGFKSLDDYLDDD